MLWDPMNCVDDLIKYLIPAVLKLGLDDCPSALLIVRSQILDVLKHQDGRPFRVDDITDTEKQIALLLALEPVRMPKALLLAHARETEGLTWKPSSKNIVVGDLRHVQRVDV